MAEIAHQHNLKSPESTRRYLNIRTRRSTLIAIIASLLVHALLLVTLKQERARIETHPVQALRTPLVVRLNPPITPQAAPNHPAENPKIQPEPPPKQTSKPKRKPRVPARPRPDAPPAAVIATAKPSLNTSVTPAVPGVDTDPTPDSAPPTDMMSYIKDVRARRQVTEQANPAARADQHDVTPDEIRTARIESNLQAHGTNGVFRILSMGVRTATFSFRGWTTDSSNYRREVIEVDAGLNGDVERAIVRRMIELIRQHYQGDFNWQSQRLDRVIVLSARMQDNAGLEDFLLREFFVRDGGLRAQQP